jgi:hypothetical protein
MSQSAAVRSSGSVMGSSSQPSHGVAAGVAAAVDAYVAASFARYEAVIVACVPALAEPRTDDPRKAFRLIARITETLVGFAVGTTVGAVASAVKRSSGEAVRRAVDTELQRLARGAGPSGTVGMPMRLPRFFASALVAAEKPLADELGARMLVRLRQATAEARRHLLALAKACPDARAFVMTVELQTPDDATAMGFTDQLSTAWTWFRERLGAKPSPASAAPAETARFARANATWQSVASAEAPSKEAPLTTHEEVLAAGFLMRIG